MGRPEKITSALLDASSLLGVVTGEETFACLKPLLAAVDREEIRRLPSHPHPPSSGAATTAARTVEPTPTKGATL